MRMPRSWSRKPMGRVAMCSSSKYIGSTGNQNVNNEIALTDATGQCCSVPQRHIRSTGKSTISRLLLEPRLALCTLRHLSEHCVREAPVRARSSAMDLQYQMGLNDVIHCTMFCSVRKQSACYQNMWFNVRVCNVDVSSMHVCQPFVTPLSSEWQVLKLWLSLRQRQWSDVRNVSSSARHCTPQRQYHMYYGTVGAVFDTRQSAFALTAVCKGSTPIYTHGYLRI